LQAKLAIAQPGDKQEQQADQVAAVVVNQINQKTIQKQGTSQTATSQNQVSNVEETANNVADPKQVFLSNYAVAKELVQGIDEALPPERILDQLLNNFKNISFKYTMTYKQGITLLKGTREGDCRTLAEAFQTVAQEYFGIKNVAIEQIKKPFLSEAADTVYQGRKRNCDNGKRWFFQNHYWATWNNKVYDVLFLSNKKTEVDMARQENPLKSMFMPEEEYYETEKGKVVYLRGHEYLTIELGMFDKLKNFVNNLGRWLARDMSAIINQIQKLLSRSGNNTSDLESLMRDVQNNRTNEINSNS
jgi:thiol-disulfide isomerase/thioredoxin